MAIKMTREEMIEDLKMTWTGIQRLDPESSFNINDAVRMWESLDDERLSHTYNGARVRLWTLLRMPQKTS
jgi:hypothetical protein